LFKYSISQIRH